ncbi:unnamed protein product [Rotaria sp. Silwood1]|nr:unnamed protein product [Rotaria sp. Silwood1]
MSNKRKIEDLYSSSLSLPLTTTEARFPSDGSVKVDMGGFGISFKSIETNAVSSCHFVLITGLIYKKRFGYLSHRATEYNSSSNKLKALQDIFRIILEDINSYNSKDREDEQTSLNINDFQHLKMVIGGGVDDEKNLNRKCVMMLNDPTINLEEKLKNENYKSLYAKLKNNVIILPPVTYLLNNDNEDEDDDNEELVIDPPGLWVKFNCYSNILRVGLEWLSKISNEYPLAFTIVDLNKHDVKFEWTINMEKIEEQLTNPYVGLYELFGLSRILYYLRSCINTGRILSRMTGIASSKLSRTENDRLLTLRDHLYKKVIGQNDAIDSVVEVIRNRAIFGKPNKPIGLFLFLGPNSVGKTELAKTLALELFDSTEKLISIDMNKYTTSNSIAQLFDSSFEGMRQQPYAVILFNQIEKVHPQFWNNLSQVLDHNHSLNEKHVNVDLTNTIWKTYRHVNDIVFFQPLTYNQLSAIIQLQVISIEERFKEKKIEISLTNKAIQSILQKSYKLFSGVGPVKDHIGKHITYYLSTVVSHSHIRIDTDVNDQYQLSIEK